MTRSRRTSRPLHADLAAGALFAAAITLAIGLTIAAPAAAQPESSQPSETRDVDVIGQLQQLLGLEPAPRAAPPRGLSLAHVDPGEPVQWRALAPGDALPERIVLLIHGLDEPGDIFNSLAPHLIEAGHTPVYFEYPNDQKPRDSAGELASALRTLAERGVSRIDIVAHSMGGLVARDVLTRSDLYAGKPRAAGLPAASRLIMLGTPNAGSPWARLSALSEVREQVIRFANEPRADRILAFLEDGLGEAGRDLLPGSAYLTELNSRPLPQLPITLVVGRIAPDAPAAAGDLADNLASAAASALNRLLGPSERAEGALPSAAAQLRRALEAAEQTIGDGVVPAESALLAGVDDVVYVEANHRGMIRTIPIEQAAREAMGKQRIAQPPAIAIILERLDPGE